ncbi:MAG: hypothetical protein Kow0062_08290 [Acidobacteriota bacterium]
MSTQAPGLAERILEAIESGRAPRQARLAAARGSLPLSRAQLVALQLRLREDDDDEIRGAATAALDAVSADEAVALAGDEESAPQVLAWLAAELRRWPEAGRVLAASTRIDAAAMVPLAESDDEETLRFLAANHRALKAHPPLGELLEHNPHLPRDAAARLLDVLEELRKEAAAATARAQDGQDAAATDEIPPARDPFLASLGIDAELEAVLPELDIDIGALAERSELLGAEDGDDEGLLARLSRMKVGQKLKLALFGGREERALLIRDSNRIVATSVVKNPKFSEVEAEMASNSRNVNQEVLRLIARHRDYGKLYAVQHNLVRNPRCPQEIAVRLVSSLRERDLKMLMRNRNVAEAVRRQARKTLEILAQRRRARVPGKR